MHKQSRGLSRLPSLSIFSQIIIVMCASFAWAAPGERTLYSFGAGSDAEFPNGTMIFDNAGNLYGVGNGGANDSGAIFKLTPSGTGKWTESVIYSFLNSAYYPGAYIAFDSNQNLYGTFASFENCGGVYQLVPGAVWTENIVFSFTDSQGCFPGSIVSDPATGNLYGTTQSGGVFNGGTVFELTPVLGGGWAFNLIYSFEGKPADGFTPAANVTLDASGNLYGTTVYGGSFNGGTVYKITHGSDGWSESTLYSFTGGFNGAAPVAGVIFDRVGNLYGTSYYNGGDDVGNVFKLTPTKGNWVIHVIHTFTGGPDGGNPATFQLAIDASGNLYGTTVQGGLYGFGTAYKLSPSTDGNWKETVLHAFTNGADGEAPDCGFVVDRAGNMYGTTTLGGTVGDGVVFQIRQ